VLLRKQFRNLAWAASLLLLASCATYKVPSSAYGPKPDDPYWAVREKAVQSPIYNYVPRKREQIKTLDARWLSWCFVGNEDDGIFGEYAGKAPYSTNINFGTYLGWSVLRNPGHNFCSYVIGTSDWKAHYNYSLIALGGGKVARAFSNAAKWPKGTDPFLDLGANDFKPYVKLNPWLLDFFIGWRKTGSFEIKIRIGHKKARSDPPAPTREPNASGTTNLVSGYN
jgi:hypothetical protein